MASLSDVNLPFIDSTFSSSFARGALVLALSVGVVPLLFGEEVLLLLSDDDEEGNGA